MIPSLKPPPTMDFQQELQTRNVYLVDDFGDEDDVFYRELRNQVLQLTAEDEEQVYENKNINMVTEQKQGFNRGPGGYYNWAGNKEDFSVPVWMLNLWRHGNGTGVFIPQVVPTKKKNKSRRKKNERGRTTYMRVEKV